MTVLTKPSGGRKTIAVLGAQLSRVWGSEFMSGVIRAAEAQDVNLVCFIGGRLGPIKNAGPQGASYGFYDLVRPEQFDGILLAADIGHGLTAEEINLLCRSFAP